MSTRGRLECIDRRSGDVLVIDTRNAFEVAIGTFPGALDPGIGSFGQFKDFTARDLESSQVL